MIIKMLIIRISALFYSHNRIKTLIGLMQNEIHELLQIWPSRHQEELSIGKKNIKELMDIGNKERDPSTKRKLKISIKRKEKDNSRFHSHKLSLDIHQLSDQCQLPEFENLIDGEIPENIASERYTSSLIENFDQSEYIKNVITQSRKVGGTRFGSPSQSIMNMKNAKTRGRKKEDKTFMYDMKKHGILKAFNDINKFSEFFEQTPSENQSSVEANSMIQKHSHSQILDSEYPDNSLRKEVEVKQEKNTKSTFILEEMQKEETKNIKSFKCIFPFQRRARSHSPPKNSVISNKIIETMNNNSPDGVLNSKERKQEKLRKNKPVIANANFIIGSYHLLNK